MFQLPVSLNFLFILVIYSNKCKTKSFSMSMFVAIFDFEVPIFSSVNLNFEKLHYVYNMKQEKKHEQTKQGEERARVTMYQSKYDMTSQYLMIRYTVSLIFTNNDS